MIYNNKTDIDINMVTGDNHSLNQLNFVALDAIEVEYVPSIKNVREAAEDLYSVKSPSDYIGVLRPKGKINTDRIKSAIPGEKMVNSLIFKENKGESLRKQILQPIDLKGKKPSPGITGIKSQKRAILRVLLSLILQENTQSNIIRKLNSHTRYAKLKAALFEYNKIFKSTHVLNLIDNMSLRKAIRTARNRTEAYHQLQRVIRKIYNGVFKGKKIMNNRVSAHAARLIANCIIAYNTIILNDIYLKMLKEGVEPDIIKEFARISPIAWIHLLFTGRYHFRKKNEGIDIEAMVHILEQLLKQKLWKVN